MIMRKVMNEEELYKEVRIRCGLGQIPNRTELDRSMKEATSGSVGVCALFPNPPDTVPLHTHVGPRL